MEIQLICSEQIKEKISRLIEHSNIRISSEAKIVLVEHGFEIPSGKLVLVFEASDYMYAIDLLSRDITPIQNESDTITGFNNNRYSLIPIKDIYHIDAHGSEILCHTQKETYYLKNTLHYYEIKLQNQGVVRINKSQLVNLINVKEIIPWFNAKLVLILRNGLELEVSKLYSKELRKILDI